ncbi:MAG: hypothetical protein FWC71_06635 [Defluviitaleaceae bacterium]|nr:hypothetical protein [Defluviitaleaceae bacterium]
MCRGVADRLDKAMNANNDRHAQAFAPPPQKNVDMPDIPRAFINNVNAKLILSHTVEEFAFEEQQVIYYYCYLAIPASMIAKAMDMTEAHINSVLGLYCERLKSTLAFFMKALPYDSQDKLDVKEILL